MDKGSKHALTLSRIEHGGFLVRDASFHDRGFYANELFASADIDEALKFMRDAINPIPPQQEPAHD